MVAVHPCACTHDTRPQVDLAREQLESALAPDSLRSATRLSARAVILDQSLRRASRINSTLVWESSRPSDLSSSFATGVQHADQVVIEDFVIEVVLGIRLLQPYGLGQRASGGNPGGHVTADTALPGLTIAITRPPAASPVPARWPECPPERPSRLRSFVRVRDPTQQSSEIDVSERHIGSL